METTVAATLRLKMVVSTVTRNADSTGNINSESINLSAVYGPEGTTNSQWSKWTPMGSLNFTVNNPAAFGRVLPGQFYFIELIQTDKDGI